MNENILKEDMLVHLQKEIKDVNIDKGILYCAGDEAFYIECLKDYCDNGRKELIEQSYSVEDWKRYTIEVHTLKSTSRTLGFENLGDMAEKMQMAAEQLDIQYIKAHHDGLLKELGHILKVISECV